MNHAQLAAVRAGHRHTIGFTLLVVFARGAAGEHLRRHNHRVFRLAENEENLRRHAGHQPASFVGHVDQDIVKHNIVDDLRRGLDLTHVALPAPFAIAEGGEIGGHIFLQTIDVGFGHLRAHGHHVEVGHLHDRRRGLIRVESLTFFGRQRGNRAGDRRINFRVA